MKCLCVADFLNKMEDGILTSYNGEDVANKLVRSVLIQKMNRRHGHSFVAKTVAEIKFQELTYLINLCNRLSKMVSYWRNNKDRIMGQIAVWMKGLDEQDSDSDAEFGAILPQVGNVK